MTRAILTLSAVLLVTLSTANAEESPSFFRAHCVKCHGANKAKGDLRIDTLKWTPTNSENVELWQAIIDRLDAKEMPPEKEPQPSDRERAAILTSLRSRVAAAAEHGSKQVVLRRLNRPQFRNSLRDLLHIDVAVEDPTEAFPSDDKEDGFDNLGEVLQMSDFLMRQYLKVARTVVDRATFDGDRPEPKTYTLKDSKSRPLNYKAPGNDPSRDYVVLYRNDERAPGDPRGQQFINSREGATHSGWYEFKFEVESRGRGNLADGFSEQRRIDYPVYRPEDLHRFEIYLTAPNKMSAIQTRPRRLVHTVDLPDNVRHVIRKRIWVPKSWRVEAGFGNGYWGVVDPILLVDPKFDLDAFRELPKKEQNSRYGKLVIDRFEKVDAPRIVIHSVTETGPHYDQWPPASHVAVYGRPGQRVEDHLLNFATRAFRRPVTREQIAPYLRLAKQSPEGIRTAIEGILCSPRFVYLNERSDELDDYAIASRLSYFLWNTMLDDALLNDAAKGRLRDAKVLATHVDRMLDDQRSDEFVHAFVWAWLKLQNTVEMAPDPMKFYEYHRNRLGDAMVKETNAFFRYLLTEDLPISNFIDSDFAVINSDLGRHYNIPGAVNTSAQFQKVSLNGTQHRGGLLGQASVLTASANGVDTSPVVRGIWILENLLGTPPSPPPPDVEVPEPDARGDLTIRELYAKHRTVESCNDCHKRIDPLGFALENFDAIGSWRTKYEAGQIVDSSGQMPSGEEFQDVAGLKQIMSRDLDQFSRNLTAKLMTYATGRRMTIADRPAIDRIVARLKSEQGGLRDLVRLVIASDTFLTK
jgi:mono/diheme cytochrome c family protein